MRLYFCTVSCNVYRKGWREARPKATCYFRYFAFIFLCSSFLRLSTWPHPKHLPRTCLGAIQLCKQARQAMLFVLVKLLETLLHTMRHRVAITKDHTNHRCLVSTLVWTSHKAWKLQDLEQHGLWVKAKGIKLENAGRRD